MTAAPPPLPTVDPVIVPSPTEDVTGDVPWQAIVWNDPVNLMSYVTYVLQKLFGYPEPQATALRRRSRAMSRSCTPPASGPPCRRPDA
jgi:hypothetical protein